MQSQGLESLFPMHDLALMGLMEIVPKIPVLRQRIKQTIRAILANPPDVIISIDSPDFCFRIAKAVKKVLPDVPIIHLVAPSVWAWRKKRAQKIQPFIDHVMCLLPFEPPLMHKANLSADYVGHPVLTMSPPSAEDIAALEKRFSVKHDNFILILPGSRQAEAKRLLPVYRQVFATPIEGIPTMGSLIVVPKAIHKLVQQHLKDWPKKQRPRLLSEHEFNDIENFNTLKMAAFSSASLALAASGTVSLELAMLKTPMVVAYKLSPLTGYLAHWLVKLHSVSLVNILVDKPVIPEFLNHYCTVHGIRHALTQVYNNPTPQIEAMYQVYQLLSKDGINIEQRMALSALAYLEKHKAQPSTKNGDYATNYE